MIAYTHPKEPPEHLSVKASSEADLRAAIANYGSYTKIPTNVKNEIFSLCGSALVKDIIFSASYEKCVYCEVNPSESGTRQNDHFLPKSVHTHLAFEWDNYLPCCHQCNSYKGKQDPSKSGAFKPGSGDPRDHIIFNTLKIEASPQSFRYSEIDQTIKMCKLNRKNLLKSRSLILIELISFENALLEAVDHFNQSKSERQRSIRLSSVRESLENVEAYSLEDQAHSAMSSDYLLRSTVVLAAKSLLKQHSE